MDRNIQNPGSAIGEAIGAKMEEALNVFLKELAEEKGHHFINSGQQKGKDNNTRKKLLLADNWGNKYNIDSVIANESMQPTILIESKYIRYKKHNRDKGSWICTAHSRIRRRYPTIRSSIAILAGSWSSTSLAMMKSFDTNFFLIPFDFICVLLKKHGIDFNWAEKDRKTATDSWLQYNALHEDEKIQIGTDMVNLIKKPLQELVLTVLDDTIQREIHRVTIELHSNIGEVRTYDFNSVEEAIEFLNNEELKGVFITTDSPTLFDPSPEIEDGEEDSPLLT